MFEDFTSPFAVLSPWKFLLNLIVTTILVGLLALFYMRFGNALSNRRRFALNFLPLALTTLLIITVVKSSLALSLGLVGALSIVRFRSAIKDPEELTFLFFTIAIGLAAGADQLIIALVAFGVIMVILLVQALLNKSFGMGPGKETMFLNISTSNKDLAAISELLKKEFTYLELKRVDETEAQMHVSFVVRVKDLQQIEASKKQLRELAPDTQLSFIEQRNIAV